MYILAGKQETRTCVHKFDCKTFHFTARPSIDLVWDELIRGRIEKKNEQMDGLPQMESRFQQVRVRC